MTIHLDPRINSSCGDCGFSSHDIHLLNNHNCEIQRNGGQCEDYPCCGHERGDCNGLKYGSDEAIKDVVYNGIWYKYCEDCGESAKKEATACPSCGSENLEYENISYDELDSEGYFDSQY